MIKKKKKQKQLIYDPIYGQLCFQAILDIAFAHLRKLSSLKKDYEVYIENYDDESEKTIQEFLIFVFFITGEKSFDIAFKMDSQPFTSEEYHIYAWSKKIANNYHEKNIISFLNVDLPEQKI